MTLFALVVKLSIRSGLVTEHDLVPAGPVPLRTEELPRAEVDEELQEQGEESADEHDPIVEFASEPDAETEPRASHDGLPLAEFPHSATSQMTETAPSFRAFKIQHTKIQNPKRERNKKLNHID